jgi:hypothetical protein
MGHHLSSLIPLPWVHLLFREDTLIHVAAEIYDDPYFVPRLWDLDPVTGTKLPNKWRSGADLKSWLNGLTLHQFKVICRSAGFACRARTRGFQKGPKRALSPLAHLPVVGEYFTSCYEIILTRGQAGDGAPSRVSHGAGCAAEPATPEEPGRSQACSKSQVHGVTSARRKHNGTTREAAEMTCFVLSLRPLLTTDSMVATGGRRPAGTRQWPASAGPGRAKMPTCGRQGAAARGYWALLQSLVTDVGVSG